MKTITLSTMLLSWMFLFCLSIQANAGEQSYDADSQKVKTLFDEIRDLAAKMEVFPVDIYASDQRGPLGVRAVLSKDMTTARTSYSVWKDRYDLTFDRYVPMFELKECACKASVSDVDNCINRMNELTPKEKALLLMAIYIFEYRNRNCFGYDHVMARRVDGVMKEGEETRFGGRAINYKPDGSIDKNFWTRWLAVIEKYKDDTTIAYPAIDMPLEELISEWEINFENCCRIIMNKWQLPKPVRGRRITGSDEYRTLLASLKDESPQEARLLLMYGEYFDLFDTGKSVSPYSGNSSPFPKTLGDIATQILMSRLNYDSPDIEERSDD